LRGRDDRLVQPDRERKSSGSETTELHPNYGPKRPSKTAFQQKACGDAVWARST
jgi:hypothetical protein